MKTGCFDSNGFLLWMCDSTSETLVNEGSDLTLKEVGQHLLANDVFLDTQANTVVERQDVSFAIDRLVILSDGQDHSTLSGLPDPCWLEVNGARQLIKSGSTTLTSSEAKTLHVTLHGAHRSNVIVVQANTQAALLDQVRAIRDQKLTACDWTQVADNGLTADQKTAWLTYRQALRDLPANQPTANTETVIWPTQPA